MPIGVLLTLLASLRVLRVILLHGQPIVPRPNGFGRESLVTDVTPTYTFVELCHDMRALLTTHTG